MFRGITWVFEIESSDSRGTIIDSYEANEEFSFITTKDVEELVDVELDKDSLGEYSDRELKKAETLFLHNKKKILDNLKKELMDKHLTGARSHIPFKNELLN